MLDNLTSYNRSLYICSQGGFLICPRLPAAKSPIGGWKCTCGARMTERIGCEVGEQDREKERERSDRLGIHCRLRVKWCTKVEVRGSTAELGLRPRGSPCQAFRVQELQAAGTTSAAPARAKRNRSGQSRPFWHSAVVVRKYFILRYISRLGEGGFIFASSVHRAACTSLQ